MRHLLVCAIIALFVLSCKKNEDQSSALPATANYDSVKVYGYDTVSFFVTLKNYKSSTYPPVVQIKDSNGIVLQSYPFKPDAATGRSVVTVKNLQPAQSYTAEILIGGSPIPYATYTFMNALPYVFSIKTDKDATTVLDYGHIYVTGKGLAAHNFGFYLKTKRNASSQDTLIALTNVTKKTDTALTIVLNQFNINDTIPFYTGAIQPCKLVMKAVAKGQTMQQDVTNLNYTYWYNIMDTTTTMNGTFRILSYYINNDPGADQMNFTLDGQKCNLVKSERIWDITIYMTTLVANGITLQVPTGIGPGTHTLSVTTPFNEKVIGNPTNVNGEIITITN